MKRLGAIALVLFSILFLSLAVVLYRSKAVRKASAENRRAAEMENAKVDQARVALKSYFEMGEVTDAPMDFDSTQYNLESHSASSYSDSIRDFLGQEPPNGRSAPRISEIMHDVYAHRGFADLRESRLFNRFNTYYKNYSSIHYQGDGEAFLIRISYADLVLEKAYKRDSSSTKTWKFFAR